MKTTEEDKTTITPNGGYEWEYAQKVDDRTTLQKVLQFIYNPQTHEIFGRTLKSWGALAIFYVIFYSILALLFAACMKVLLATLNDEYPKWQLGESIIGTNPGLGFRPMANNTDAAAVIWFNRNTKKSWIDAMKIFKDENYRVKTSNTTAKSCSYNKGEMQLAKDEFCLVDLDQFGDCSATYSYGFSDGRSVCVFLKLNRIYKWEPEYYNNMNILPEDIPIHTRTKIEEKIKMNEGSYIWVSCDGASAHDKDNVGEIAYYPTPGFAYYFYPYLNVQNYMSPLVAVHFKNPKPNVLINIECRVWAKNIVYIATSQQREGGVHFELMIDP